VSTASGLYCFLRSRAQGKSRVKQPNNPNGRHHSAEESTVRHTPEDIEGVRACLDGYPDDMKVEIQRDVPVVAKQR